MNIGTLQKSQSANDITTGTITVGTTAVQFDSEGDYTDVLGVEIETTGTVYRGDSTVTTANGISIVASVPNFIPLRDLSKLYLVASAAGQTVKYLIYR